MTRDDILALSGEELDALVAEKVMGDDKEWLFHAPLLNWSGRHVHRHDLEGDDVTAEWYRNEPRGEWEYCGAKYSRDGSRFLPILNRMIVLGWLPGMDYNDSDGGWMVSMCHKGIDYEDAPKFISMSLPEAVCKCALLAVGV
jgi:hypothetical protein